MLPAKQNEWKTMPRLRDPVTLTGYFLRVPPQTLETLRRITEVENRTVSSLIRAAVDTCYGDPKQ